MTGVDQDPCEKWLDEMIGKYRATLSNPEVIGDDDTGYLVTAEGATPQEMASGFQAGMTGDAAGKLATLLAYAVRRAALLEMDLEHLKRNP
jgi:hypothetical protein